MHLHRYGNSWQIMPTDITVLCYCGADKVPVVCDSIQPYNIPSLALSLDIYCDLVGKHYHSYCSSNLYVFSIVM